MSSYHICPVCDAPGVRKGIKTCGKRTCLDTWKDWANWAGNFRDERMRRAEMSMEERFKYDMREKAKAHLDGNEVSSEELEAIEAAEPKPDTRPQFLKDLDKPGSAPTRADFAQLFKPKGGDSTVKDELPGQEETAPGTSARTEQQDPD